MKIEFDGPAELVVINDVPIAMQVLENLTNPDERFFYRIEKYEGRVLIRQWTLESLLRDFGGGSVGAAAPEPRIYALRGW